MRMPFSLLNFCKASSTCCAQASLSQKPPRKLSGLGPTKRALTFTTAAPPAAVAPHSASPRATGRHWHSEGRPSRKPPRSPPACPWITTSWLRDSMSHKCRSQCVSSPSSMPNPMRHSSALVPTVAVCGMPGKSPRILGSICTLKWSGKGWTSVPTVVIDRTVQIIRQMGTTKKKQQQGIRHGTRNREKNLASHRVQQLRRGDTPMFAPTSLHHLPHDSWSFAAPHELPQQRSWYMNTGGRPRSKNT
mmetsp:Transcript_37927/g.114584  ORF Transcript_37927/g.114584 Transcript_37927/m.114584 type:complete len:247 (-) Transcript_37927:1583-2323(-)